eukprot:TRINITY_DN42137_c0_g1_i1.p1 TRINITY_DN42137_c0_g1~~TRINITY_DN42137_c0_g1_i1.p1  ORF type:complete len:993 (-),score=182.52 TRINITY_DN42137_c0_g1_i1:16-2736(-)
MDPDFTELRCIKHRLLDSVASLHPAMPGESALRRRTGLFVVPSRSPKELLASASEPLGPDEADFPVSVLKATDFDLDPSKQRLCQLWASLGLSPGQGPGSQTQNQEQHCLPQAARTSVSVQLNTEPMVRVAGGLLRFMERNRTQLGDLDGPWQRPCVQDVRLYSPADLLFADMQTLTALQVFSEEPHPSMVRGFARPREGLSLCGVLDSLVASSTGRAMLRRWLQQPSRDLDVLQERQDAVQCMVDLVRSSGAELVRDLHRELREVRDLQALLVRIYGCYHFDNVGDWRTLVATLGHMSSALELLQQASKLRCSNSQPTGRSSLSSFLDGSESAAEAVCAVEDLLKHILDLEGCTNSSDDPSGHGGSLLDASLVRVRTGVDRQLDRIRKQYRDIDHYLTEVSELERERLASQLAGTGADVSELRVILFHYFPQLGFHSSLPNPLAGTNLGEADAEAMEALKQEGCIPIPAEDWSYQFAGSGRLFYKCDLARRLDGEVGDLVVQARELELEVLLQLLERFRIAEPQLRRAAQLLAEADVLVAFGTAAVQFNWIRPQFDVSTPGLLRIVQGRHPLVEATAVSHHGFVPNSTELGITFLSSDAIDNVRDAATPDAVERDKNRVQVVTGANLSGKSVYLKQVGLITFMAHVGLFVPAEEIQLGLCDFIFSRMPSCETVALRGSSFNVDLSQLSVSLRHATDSSLVLLDEFGKGTRAADGVALLGATVQHFCRWKSGPKVVITTHFTEIFRFGLVSTDEPGLQISHLRVLPPEEQDVGQFRGEMKMVSDSSADGNGEIGVAYLYQLVPGCCERSFGLECARRAGLEASVVQRAAEILAALEQGESALSVSGSRKQAQPPDAASQARSAESACRLVIDRLCSLDLEDQAAVRALLGFVWAQQDGLRVAGAGG